MRRLGLFVGTLGLLIGISVGQQVSEAALRERARAAADTLLTRLLGRLKDEYQQGGAERGVRVCTQVAQSLTRQVASEQGVQIRRVSLKNRNPRNAPDAWERQVLQRWERDLKAGKPISEVAQWRTERGQRVYRYMRPIALAMPLCMECHGDPKTIKPEVRRLIRQNYPNDKAIGYKLDDLRGAFSVTITPTEVQR
ncbi:MAG: Tll0287-like domain-containing protein [Fimbriimonadales bacterium]